MALKIETFRPHIFRGDLSAVTSPPIDIISPEYEMRLKSLPNNITHVTIPKHGDVLAAARVLNNWIKEGIIEKYPDNCIILLQQDVPSHGRYNTRIGIIAPVETSSDRNDILPHEETFQWAVSQRQQLMETTNCQLEPIFIAVNGTNFERILRTVIRQITPAKKFTEQDGVINTVYFLTDSRTIDNIKAAISREKGIVADGHHRLQATRNLYNSGKGNFWSYTLSYITSLQNDSLFIGGIHRVLTGSHTLDAYYDDLLEYFDIEPMSGDQRQRNVTAYDGHYFSLKPKSVAFDAIGCSKKYHYDGDPTLVSTLILRQIIGFTQNDLSTKVIYTHSRPLAVDEVDSKKASLAFLMPEWDKSVFISMIEDGRILPQKSTYFYPKVPSGVALYCSQAEL